MFNEQNSVLDREGAKMTEALDHGGAKTTKNAKREGGAPRRVSSRPSRFVSFANLRDFVLQNTGAVTCGGSGSRRREDDEEREARRGRAAASVFATFALRELREPS